MRNLLSIFMMLSAILAVTYAGLLPVPTPDQPEFPTFPGQGPFNPKQHSIPQTDLFKTRLRRSPDDDKNKVTVNASKDGGKSAYQVEYERKIIENDHGSIGANVGINKNPGQKPQTQVGVSGSFSW